MQLASNRGVVPGSSAACHRDVSPACVCGIQGEVCLGNACILLRYGGYLDGSNDPAKHDSHQQTQEQRESTHVTKIEYGKVVLWSIKIYISMRIYFSTFLHGLGPAVTESMEFSPRILSGKVASDRQRTPKHVLSAGMSRPEESGSVQGSHYRTSRVGRAPLCCKLRRSRHGR